MKCIRKYLIYDEEEQGWIKGLVASDQKLKKQLVSFKFPPTWICVALTATHTFKWVKITPICLIWDLIFANGDI